MKTVYTAPDFTVTVFEPEDQITAGVSVGGMDEDGDRDAVIIW